MRQLSCSEEYLALLTKRKYVNHPNYILCLLLCCFVGIKVSAQSFDISNDYSTSYYTLINDGREVELSSVVFYEFVNTYSIPEEVTYMKRKYKVTGIGIKAFENSPAFTSMSIPNTITYIREYAFQGCSKITTIDIPNSVKSIGRQAFFLCSSLKSVKLPNSITTIEPWTFESCASLEEIILPNSIKTIGEEAFGNCRNLHTISIPYSVTVIEDVAFDDCTSLTSIVIPSNVEKIGYGAFYGCGLESIFSQSIEPPTIVDYCFDNHTMAFDTLYVPKGTKEKYKAAKGWNFTYIEETEMTGINNAKMNKEEKYRIYNLNGKPLKQLQKGVNIINGKKIIMK